MNNYNPMENELNPVPETEEIPQETPQVPKVKKKKRKKKNYKLRLIVIAVLIICAVVVTHLNYFDVKGIAVTGNNELSDHEIMEMSGIQTGKSIFDVHPILVQHKIKKNLYVQKVNVDRKFPDEVIIKVTERSCRAQFVKGKKFVVTDNEGTVIDIAGEEARATLVEGITVEKAKLKKKIKVKQESLLEKSLEFVTLAEKKDLYFKRVSFDGNNVDAYIYDELVCKGKYSDVVKSIKSGTLKSVVYDLYQKGIEKGTINVYNNDYCFFTP